MTTAESKQTEEKALRPTWIQKLGSELAAVATRHNPADVYRAYMQTFQEVLADVSQQGTPQQVEALEKRRKVWQIRGVTQGVGSLVTDLAFDTFFLSGGAGVLHMANMSEVPARRGMLHNSPWMRLGEGLFGVSLIAHGIDRVWRAPSHQKAKFMAEYTGRIVRNQILKKQ